MYVHIKNYNSDNLLATQKLHAFPQCRMSGLFSVAAGTELESKTFSLL